MQETKIHFYDALKESKEDADLEQLKREINEMNDGGGTCSEAEPFALQVLDDSMLPEFDPDCIIIIDPEGHVKDGSYVFAKDLNDEYIFRQLRITDGKYFLVPTNDLYESFEIPGLSHISGVITQRAGKKRSYHKWFDR